VEGLRHRGIEIGDEALDPLLEMLLGGEVAAPEQLADQDREPNLDLVDPGRVLRREVEGDPMRGIAKECLACRHRLEDARLSLLPKLFVDAATIGNQTDHAFGQWVLRLSQTTCHRADGAVANRSSRNATKSASVRLSPMRPRTLPVATSNAAISAFVPCRIYSNSRRSTCPGFIGRFGAGAFQRLDTGHLVDRNGLHTLLR
jgi:hypothetical protein